MIYLHQGGEPTTIEDANSIAVPPATATYMPVPHGTLITMVEAIADQELDCGPPSAREIALNRGGKHMFFSMTWEGDTEDAEAGFSIGGVNSYDKTLPVKVVGGSRVFVCDNLAVVGDSMRTVRKHTPEVLQDLPALLAAAMPALRAAHEGMTGCWRALRQLPLDLERGYALLGIMLGQQVLRPQQATVAYRAWREDWNAAGRSFYGLYQACTEGTKRGAASWRLDSTAGTHEFLTTTAIETVEDMPSRLSGEHIEALYNAAGHHYSDDALVEE